MSNTLRVIQEKEPWFSEGLRFSCTECGKCCTGAPGYVWVTVQEIAAIAAHMSLSIDEFSKRYVRQIGERYSLVEDPKTFDCAFLKNKQCQIYSVRPKQCRTFPWWLQNLRSEEDWQRAALYCEGINSPNAPTVDCKTILEQLHNLDAPCSK